MADSQTIQIKDIGEVWLERSKCAKRMIITVRPGKGVRVAVPQRTSFKKATQFVRSKKSWIEKHLAKIQTYEKQKQVFEENFHSIDKSAAQKTVISRLRQLARQHGFTYNKAAIRNQRTRWGSCSVKGNISLNIKLVALPQELADYVILHELVHTRVHNHSKQFWQEMDKYTKNGKAKARRLLEYGLRIL